MEILDLEEAAKYLKLKRSALYRLTSEKKIPHFKLQAKLRFSKEQLNFWLSEKRVEAEHD